MERLDQAPRAIAAKLTKIEDFAEMIRGADLQHALLSGGKTEWDMLRVHFDHCSIHYTCETSHMLSTGAIDRGLAGFFIPMGGEVQRVNGYDLREEELVFFRAGAEHTSTSKGSVSWLAFGVPDEELARVRAALCGGSPEPVRGSCQYVRLQPAAWRKLHRELLSAVAVVRSDPSLLENEAARRGMEQSLLLLLAQSLDGQNGAEAPAGERARMSHAQVVAHSDEYLNDRWKEPVYLADLCQATGVSERTLRYAFQAIYGTSPNHYLKARRLAQARRLLREGNPAMTITAVAQSLGIWNPGRFAVEYRQMYGESPSQTLQSGG